MSSAAMGPQAGLLCPISSSPYINATQAVPISAKPGQSNCRSAFPRSIADQGKRENQRHHAKRNVEEEDPAPCKVRRNKAANRRSDYGAIRPGQVM